MDRRRLLQGLAASVLAGAAPARLLARAQPPRRVIVIGAGIVGAAIAYELAKRGAAVTIVEQARPASGTTRDSFAYLNASTKSGSRPYFELNRLGVEGWRAWQQEAGAALPIRWGGAVYWRDTPDEASKLAATIRTVQGWGYAAEPIDAADIARLLPGIAGASDAGGFFADEGAVDPEAAVAALLARAGLLGAKLITQAKVTGLIVADGGARGVRTADGELLADTVVLAAGLGSRALAEAQGIALPLNPSPGILLHTRPHAPLIGRLAFAPGATFRQMVDGRILASVGHEGAPATGADPAEIGRSILATSARYLPALRGAAVDRISVGLRVMPADTLPIVGVAPAVRNLYLAATHSGVTLAPIVGRVAAAEILDGVHAAVLDGFRPDRFRS